ncbi:MAG: hypothetical protein QMB94_09030, partial [Phycisphaerales bacterium]
YSDDPGALGMIAVMTAADPDEEVRNIPAARKAADAMLQKAGARDPEALAVSAKVAFAEGDANRAIREQMQAWMTANPDLKPEFKRNLDIYRGQAKRPGAARR